MIGAVGGRPMSEAETTMWSSHDKYMTAVLDLNIITLAHVRLKRHVES